MQKQQITIQECYEIMGIMFVNEDIIISWTELLDMKQGNIETFLNEQERKNFKADMVREFAFFRDRLDPTSRLLLAGSSPTMPSETTFWNMNFPNVLLQNFRKGGTYGCIHGLPRTGKTSLAVSFMELFIADTQLHILTNIIVKEEMETIHQCTTLSELVKCMSTYTGWICILDETGTFVGKKRALSSENVDFENLGRFVGKLGGRLIMITHDMSRDIPPILQSWMSEQYRKTDLTSMVAILNKPGGLRMNRMITNIPDCNLSFITEDITSLQFDISIKKLLSEIQTTKGVDRDEQRNAILGWLEEHKRSEAEEKNAVKKVEVRAKNASVRFKELLRKGLTKMKAYEMIAGEMNLSVDTIRYYISFIRRKGEETGDDEGSEEDTTGEDGEVDEKEEG
jgi:hypothetical protein